MSSGPPPLATEVPLPPSAEEAHLFFYGLPSQPKLVARTNSLTSPYTRPMIRVLCPVSDTGLIETWKACRLQLYDALRSALTAHSIDWSAFLPLVVHGWPFKDDSWGAPVYTCPMPKHEASHFLVIGVRPGSCSWETGFAAATACRAILADHLDAHSQDMHVLVAELALIPLTTPPPVGTLHTSEHPPTPDMVAPVPESESLAPSPPESSTTSLQRLFDPKFSELEESGLYKYEFFPDMQAINDHVAGFMPFPGQVIQPFMEGSRNERPQGSLCCYLRLGGSVNGSPQDSIFALTSRHVAIGDLYHYYRDYKAPDFDIQTSQPRADSNPPIIRISWGSRDQFVREMANLKVAMGEMPIWLMRKALYNGQLSARKEEQLSIAEECVGSYVPALREEMARQCADVEDGGKGAAGRAIGRVAFAGRHGLNKMNGWRDWALIALDGPDGVSTTSASLCPPSHTNHAYIGRTLSYVYKFKALDEAEALACQTLLSNIDRAGFIQLRPPALAAEVAQGEVTHAESDHDPNKPFCVFKSGGKTGTTMGQTNPIEAVVRTPLPGKDIITWALPVVSITINSETEPWMVFDNTRVQLKPFSQGGDSGSCIFDANGTIIAMVDAGLGSVDEHRRLLVQQNNVRGGSSSPVPLPGDPTDPTSSVPSQPPGPVVPPGFHSWYHFVGGSKDSWKKTDITLATDFRQVLQDIETTTGLTANVF